MWLDNLPSTWHRQIALAVDTQHARQLTQMRKLVLAAANVLDHVVADDRVEGFVSKRQRSAFDLLKAIAVAFDPLVNDVDSVDFAAISKLAGEMICDHPGTRAHFQHPDVTARRYFQAKQAEYFLGL